MSEVPKMPAWQHSINGQEPRSRAHGSRSAVQLSNWRRLEAPFFYAANAQVLISGHSATLLFTRPHPAILPDGNIAPAPLREPVVLVEMSLTALKELCRSAADVIQKVEEKSAKMAPHSIPKDRITEPVLNGARKATISVDGKPTYEN